MINSIDLNYNLRRLRTNYHYFLQILKKPFLHASSEEKLREISPHYDLKTVHERVNYYNKLSEPFTLQNPTSIKIFKQKGKTVYKLDLFNVLNHFNKENYFQYLFGDSTKIPDCPTFIKARDLHEDNQNSVIFKLESYRHFFFLKDPTPYEKKKNYAVWRGGTHGSPLRKVLIEKYANKPNLDIKIATRKNKQAHLSISQHLNYKFIISIEGNDVATNTKWIMSSNSLCFMPRPTRESWFMEGILIPDYHYVLLNDDFSNLEEKIEYYTKNTDAALEIIKNAHEFIAPFKNENMELLISLLVAKKYFRLCSNNHEITQA